MDLNKPPNPKRNGSSPPKHINWFPYYAGYNSQFVHDVLDSLKVKPQHTVLDPWNGSGTTTTAAYRLGAQVVGLDINPVMVVAAKSALVEPGIGPSLVPLCTEILQAATSSPISRDSDPLSTWFAPNSARAIRKLHTAIWKVLVDTDSAPSLSSKSVASLSTLASFYLTALMRTTRHFIAPFVGSNPTWVKNPKRAANRLRTPVERIHKQFATEVQEMANTLAMAFQSGLEYPAPLATPQLQIGSSLSLPLKARSVNAVLSSPPYLTRIDYAVATKPELAALGMSLGGDFQQLRRDMTGAPTVRTDFKHSESFGRSCNRFLSAVKGHASKGSHNYYYKLFIQYFADMEASLSEIARVLRKNAKCVLVVQDSYYKELHADLAKFITEIAASKGLKLFDQHNFRWDRNMARINTRSRAYRDSISAVESVLWFAKG